MFFIYGVTLISLFIILVLLWREEKAFRKTLSHGLANKYWLLREKRSFVRFDKEIKIRYDLLNRPPNLRNSKTTNISRQGLCLLTYEKLKEKTYLNLELDVPGLLKPVTLIGQINWTKELVTRDAQGRRLFYVGIGFSKINPESEAILLAHLDTLKPPQV